MMVFAVNSSLMGQLAASLIAGENNFITKMIGAKVESLGKDLVSDLIRQSFGKTAVDAATSLGTAIMSGTPGEFKKARDQWLNAINAKPLTKAQSKLSERFQQIFQTAAREQSRPDSGHWRWSKSRNEWLNEDWKHDWRTQPRDKIGRWIPGRLKTPYVSSGVKRARSARRRAIRKQIKEMLRGD